MVRWSGVDGVGTLGSSRRADGDLLVDVQERLLAPVRHRWEGTLWLGVERPPSGLRRLGLADRGAIGVDAYLGGLPGYVREHGRLPYEPVGCPGSVVLPLVVRAGPLQVRAWAVFDARPEDAVRVGVEGAPCLGRWVDARDAERLSLALQRALERRFLADGRTRAA